MKIEAKSRLLAFDREVNNVAAALLRAVVKLDPQIKKPKMKQLAKGMEYTFQPETKLTMVNILKAIADLDPKAGATRGKDMVVFIKDTPYGVQYEEEFKVFYNEAEPDAKLFQVLHLN